MLVPNPFYVRDPETGESRTREFLIRLLSTGGGPVELKDGSTAPATVASVLSPSVPNPKPLYIANPTPEEVKHKSECRQFIGRAAKASSSRNPDEELWCIIADVSQACRYLTNLQRRVLGLRYFYDNEAEDVTNALGLTLAQVTDLERTALDRLVGILDSTEE